MKLVVVQKLGIHLLLLLYCFTLFSFTNLQSTPIQLNVSSEIDECRSSQSSPFHFYVGEQDVQIKTYTENETNSNHKKTVDKQGAIFSSDLSFKANQFKVRGIKDVLEHCYPQTDFNFPFHSFW